LLSDDELIQRIRRRDSGAFDEAVARYGDEIRRKLYGIVRDAATADDLLQEVFLRLWTRAEQYAGAGSLGGWLGRIATNLALNHLRAARRSRQRPLRRSTAQSAMDDEDDWPEPAWMIDPHARGADELADLAERREILRGLVDRLPDDKRRVFRLVREEQMGIGQVAERLGIPEGTVKSRLHYAIRRLREQWEDLQEQWEST
jgi:RNA polymerase sigma-70 factor (ECF subfamily)